jgi:hypothetical protein
MIGDFEDLCTYVYVLVDDCYRAVAAPYDRRPGPRSGFTDAELIALALVAEMVGMPDESRFLGYVRRDHAALFPLLPERSRYNRRKRGLGGAINAVRREVCARLLALLAREHPDGADALEPLLIDSLPVPVVGLGHSRGSHRWWPYAAYGRVPSKRETIYGFRLHMLLAAPGAILDFELAPANRNDKLFAEPLLSGMRRLRVLGDGAYVDFGLEALLLERDAVELLAPRREDQRGRRPARFERAMRRRRRLAETVFAQLAGQFGVQTNRAKCMSGLVSRLHAKLAAHTLGMYLNALLGRPLLALADLAHV